MPQTDCKLSYKSALHAAHTPYSPLERGVALMQVGSEDSWMVDGWGAVACRSAIIELTGHTNLVSHRIN